MVYPGQALFDGIFPAYISRSALGSVISFSIEGTKDVSVEQTNGAQSSIAQEIVRMRSLRRGAFFSSKGRDMKQCAGTTPALRCRQFLVIAGRHHTKTSISIGLLLVFSITLLTQCTYEPSFRRTTWHFTVPDNYQGFLVIQYTCRAGEPLIMQGENIFVSFSDEGVYCTSDASFAWQGDMVVSTRSGATVPMPLLWDAQGYGFYASSLTTIHGPPRQQFGIFWVGDLQYLADIRNKAEYNMQLDAFMREQFGVPIIFDME